MILLKLFGRLMTIVILFIKKKISVFYPGGPLSGIIVNYNNTSLLLKATSTNGCPPGTLLGIQENTGIPCPDLNAMFPNYIPCQANSFSIGCDNSCLNITINKECKATVYDTCFNLGFKLQQGISTDGSYRYKVNGKLSDESKEGKPICLLSVDWLKDWNQKENAETLGDHACK